MRVIIQMTEWPKVNACTPRRENKKIQADAARETTTEGRSEVHRRSKRGNHLGKHQASRSQKGSCSLREQENTLHEASLEMYARLPRSGYQFLAEMIANYPGVLLSINASFTWILLPFINYIKLHHITSKHLIKFQGLVEIQITRAYYRMFLGIPATTRDVHITSLEPPQKKSTRKMQVAQIASWLTCSA